MFNVLIVNVDRFKNTVFPTFVVIDEPVTEERVMEDVPRVERVIEDVPIARVVIDDAISDESCTEPAVSLLVLKDDTVRKDIFPVLEIMEEPV